MLATHEASRSAPRDDSTLGALLERVAYAEVPSRFYALLQVCAPLAVQASMLEWHRTAGWLFAATTLGLWGLAQQHLEGYADLLDAPPEPQAATRAWRFVRRGAAVVGTLVTLVLVLEGFARLLSAVFNCPGCAA